MFPKNTTVLLVAAIVAAASLFAPQASAQETKAEALKEKGEITKLNEGWTTRAAVGLGLDQALFVNPKLGGGQNLLGLRGVLTATAAYKKGRLAWDNVGAFSYGIQRTGAAVNPFIKSLDELKLASLIGYEFADKSPWNYALLASFRTQVTPSYEGNFLTPYNGAKIVGTFLAPAEIKVSPGINYKPSDDFSVIFSPASLRLVVVADDSVAIRGNQGNTIVERNAQGYVTKFKNVDVQFGASLNASYKTSFFEKRILFATGLGLFTNYLKDPQNIVVDWSTDTKFNLIKGFGITLKTQAYYDHNVNVMRNVGDQSGTVGPGLQFFEGLYITYDRTF